MSVKDGSYMQTFLSMVYLWNFRTPFCNRFEFYGSTSFCELLMRPFRIRTNTSLNYAALGLRGVSLNLNQISRSKKKAIETSILVKSKFTGGDDWG